MIGKIGDEFFARVVLAATGAPSSSVVVGPQMGVDAGVLKVGDYYLAVAEDPVFPGPTTSPAEFGWLTVHIGASDVAVMGIRPQFMTYSLLLPPGSPEEYLAALVKSIGDTARELGITVVGGHTGFYSAVAVPTVGGVTVWGLGKEYISSAGARVGDVVVVTKGAGVEAAALLAAEFGEGLVAGGVPRELVARARERFWEITVVADALTAAAVGGVHAMHDATEGGLARGLYEVAQASQVGLRISKDQVPVPEDIKAVCSFFGLNPYEVISEGTLVLTCAPEAAPRVVAALEQEGIPAAVIGEVVPAAEGCFWVTESGREELRPPEVDRFWEAFFGALAEKKPQGEERS